MDIDDLSDQEKLLLAELRRDEGVKPHLYKDTVGKWTIGVGRNLSDRGLSSDEINYLLINDVDIVVAELDKNTPWWRDLDPVRKRVLINMCFNMGWPTLAGFKNTLAAMKRGDYKKAAAGMRASKWYGQVNGTDTKNGRGVRLAKMMETGNEPT